MNWFAGDIGNAIVESKTKKLIFLVFTFDANSTEMDELWNDEHITTLCNKNCVSVRFEAESEPCTQFKQIYPITCYPTTYLIGNNGGTPIRIISGNVSKEELISKLENAIDFHNSQIKSEISIETPEPQAVQSAAAAEVVSDEQTNANQKKLDERIALAKEKLKQIQEKKRIEEEEKLRVAEIERRKLGQEVLKSKKDKEEQELKRIAEEKRKEKLDDELAKKRIIERIQQDREDKQKKYAQEKVELEKSKEAARTQLELAKQQERLIEAAAKSTFARIQFRLTDGSSVVNQFDPNQTLDEARLFITEKLKEMNENQSFTMHSVFPKRDYTSQDMSFTLRELQLVPSASLLIIPTRSKISKSLNNILPTTSASSTNATTSSTVVSYVSDLFGFLLLPFTIIWDLVTGFVGIRGTEARNPTVTTQPRSPAGQERINLRRRNIPGIHDRDGDDENATWNGNSTQQM